MRSSGIRFLDRVRMRWRSLWDRGRLDRELAEELQFHRAALLDQYRSQGLDQAEAERRVRQELGRTAAIGDEVRDQRGWQLLDQVVRDTQLAFRAFRKQPGFALTAVLTIALGMGANTALFTVMHAAFFRPLPVVDPAGVTNIYLEVRDTPTRSSVGSRYFVSFPEYQEIRRGATTAEVAGIKDAELSWRGLRGRTVRAQLVSDNLLPLIGARPVLGRFFTREETAAPGFAPVAVLSHDFWRRNLGADSSIVGKIVTLNRTAFTVIGVADPATRGPLIETAQVWIPLTMQRLTRPGDPLIDQPATAWIQLFARKHASVTEAAFRAEMRVLGRRALASHDTAARGLVTVVPASYLNMPNVRAEAFPVLGLIWVAFSLILVVACANVANLLLARGLSRQREIAVRLALGAGRRRVLIQLITESAWLGALGGALGLGLAMALGRLVPALIPAGTEFQLDLTPDRSILLFTALVSILSGIGFGLLPAFQATSPDLTPGLRTEGLSAAGRPRGRLQQALVGIQIALCVVLLVNAGLLVRSFNRALSMDVGKPLDHLLIASFDLRQQQYTAERAEEFFRRLGERVDGLGSVVRSGTSFLDPELSSADNLLGAADSVVPEGQRFRVSFDEVGSGYFEAAGLRVLAGRTFTEQEVRARSPVMVVDRRFADERLDGRAVGKRIWLRDQNGQQPYQIIGVVASTQPLGVGAAVRPTYYVPMVGLRFLEARLWVRYRGEASSTTAAIRKIAQDVDPEVGAEIHTIEDNVREALRAVRLMSGGLTTLGALALILASTGLFGVIAFSIGRRAREIAIRMAVGAAPRQILTLVLRQGASPVVGGLLAGLAAAVAGGHLIRAALHGVSPFDPIAIGGVVVAVGLGAGLAFLVPARRAAAVRPGALLRVD